MTSKPSGQTMSEANQIGVEMLITDAQAGLTFLDLAVTSDKPEDRARRVEEAHRAYRTILSFFPRLSPTAEQKHVLTERMNRLRARLREAGVALDKD